MAKKTDLTAQAASRALALFRNPEKARFLKRFFKTGPGEYGAGDQFLGIQVPKTRSAAKTFQNLSLSEIQKLLKSKIHEERLLALFILVLQYQKFSKLKNEEPKARLKEIVEFYLRNTRYVNNWDLVDSSAPSILGPWLFDRNRAPLLRLAQSAELWNRRIAIMSTFYFIRQNDFQTTFDLVERLLDDPEDLIHKAAGWMLREIGNRDLRLLRRFLDRHSARMPRTMLRYAIEKLPENLRKAYLQKRTFSK